MKKFTLYVMSVLLSAAGAFAFDSAPENVRIANDVVPSMIEAGSLRVDKATCKAWIDPIVWLRFDAEMKGKAAAAIAVYCSAHDPVIDLYDAQSARLIARWAGPRAWRFTEESGKV
jgi:hypothetical protein